eukprot:8120620-Pyramimonas_sp.AAC.1
MSPDRRAALNYNGASVPHSVCVDVVDAILLETPFDIIAAEYGLFRPKHHFYILTEEAAADMLDCLDMQLGTPVRQKVA